MNAEMWFKDILDRYQDDPDYLTEELLLDITDQISVRLDETDLSAADLAKRLGVSRAYVSQILNGKPNMTVRTLVGIAHALDQRVSVTLRDRHERRLDLSRFVHPVRAVTPERHDADADEAADYSAIAA